MSFIIRPMVESDRREVMDMMKVFYESPAVLSNGSDEIFSNDIDFCVGDSPFLEGYIFEFDGFVAGYGMLAKSFSTEFGRPCIWIEDIYVKYAFRGKKIGGSFLEYVKEKYSGHLLRLEVELENDGAYRLYQKNGFEVLPYTEMKR